MQDITTPREKILKKVRAGLLNKFPFHFSDVDQETDVFFYPKEEPEESFAVNYTRLGGGFIYCHNEFDFREKLIAFLEKRKHKKLFVQDRSLLEDLDNLGLETGSEQPDAPLPALLSAECIVARTGALVLSSTHASRKLIHEAETLIVRAQLSRTAIDMKEAFTLLKNRYGRDLPSMLSFVMGPARVIDKEKQVHKSPDLRRELILFLVNDT